MIRKAVLLILALALMLPAVPAAAEEAGVMTWREFQAGEFFEPVTVDTYVQGFSAWSDWSVSFYTQGPDGAYFISTDISPQELAEFMVPGLAIRVSGTKSQLGNLSVIEDPSFAVRDAEPWIAEAEDMTDLLGMDGLRDYQVHRVVFRGLTMEPSRIKGSDAEYAFLYEDDGSGSHEKNSDLYFRASLDGDVYTFKVETDVVGAGNDSEVYRAVEDLEIGDVVDLEGFLYWYYDMEPHITSVKTGTEVHHRPVEPEPDQLTELLGIWEGTCEGTYKHERTDITVYIRDGGEASMVFSTNGQVLSFPCVFPESGNRVRVSIPSNYIGLSEVRTTFSLKDGILHLGITMIDARGGSQKYSADCTKQ